MRAFILSPVRRARVAQDPFVDGGGAGMGVEKDASIVSERLDSVGRIFRPVLFF
jgi:hypothetical protein